MSQTASLPCPSTCAESATPPAPALRRLALAWWSGWTGTTSTLGRDGIR
jgi:hypothetical protein